MTTTELTITVDGQAEEILAQIFIDAVRHSLEVLHDLDSALSLKRRGTLRWVIGSLHYGSPAVIAVRAIPPAEGRDYGPDVIRHYLDGLEQLLEGATLPPVFSDDALEAVKRLARLSGDGGYILHIQHEQRIVKVTERIAANIDELSSRSFVATGSLEGTLEMVTIHDQTYFRVYDAIYSWGVPCYFNRDLLDTVKEGIGRRVTVSGQVRSDRIGKPLSLRVTELSPFPEESELPKPSEIRGLVKDMTDGRPSEEYLREIRNDDH